MTEEFNLSAGQATCKGIKVLVTEDALANQVLMQAYFEELGCVGDYANNGQEAVDKLKAGNKYNIVLMDMQMPVMGGIEATEIIRKDISQDIPIIALTGSVSDEDQKRAKDAGMNDFLAKPVDMDEMSELIIKYSSR